MCIKKSHTVKAASALLLRRALGSGGYSSLLGTGMGKVGHVCEDIGAFAKRCPGCPAGGLGVAGCFFMRTGGRWEQDWGLQKLDHPSNRIQGELGERPPGLQWDMPCPWHLWACDPSVSSVPPQPTQARGETRASSRAGGDQQSRCCPPSDSASTFCLCFFWPGPECL